MSRRVCVVAIVALAVAGCAQAELVGGDAAADGAADDRGDPPDACLATAELCNDLDDDCDQDVDEEFPDKDTACTVGVGACQALGLNRCTADGSGVECDAVPGHPGDELCNGVDDDCDHEVDEDFPLGDACDGPDADRCAEGVWACGPSGDVVCTDTSGDDLEVCNGLDDDCDLEFDEGFGVGEPCDGPDGDACNEGYIVCALDGTAVCSDDSPTNVETCNGLDDDCRNGVDDGFAVGDPCSVGLGACRSDGFTVCDAAGTGVTCDAVAGTGSPEICGDGIDQDCNGPDVSCPINDLAGGAVNISAGGTFTVDLVAAHDDDASTASGCGSSGGRDVFYYFTLSQPEVVYLDTFGSSYDTVIRLYDGSCPSRSGTPQCDDDAGVCTGLQSQLARQLAAGTYCVVVDQYSSSQTTGATVLSFVRGGRPGTAITAGSGTRTGTTCGNPNSTSGNCRASTAPDVGYFFTLCPSETRTVGANTCTGTSYDSVVYLRRAGNGTDLACNDDTSGCGSGLQSSFTGASAAGPGLFFLVVDGYSSACGSYSLSYTM